MLKILHRIRKKKKESFLLLNSSSIGLTKARNVLKVENQHGPRTRRENEWEMRVECFLCFRDRIGGKKREGGMEIERFPVL